MADSNGNSIPNLLSLRGARGSSRGLRGLGAGRGRRGGNGPPGFSSSASGPTQDQTVQGTDDDAAGSRLSAVNLGYLDDSYAQYFVDGASGPPPRRLPIINRGTYTRTCALDRLIDSFLSHGVSPGASGPGQTSPPRKQIISLGAGTDTRIFRLFASGSHPGLSYHEIDFPVTVNKKSRLVQNIPALRQVLGSPTPQQTQDESTPTSNASSWSSRPPNGGRYYCHAFDLRHLIAQDPSALQGFEPTVPTLLISECCLCYLETSAARDVVKWFTDKTPNVATILYEPVRPDDPFGRMMVSNLAARRIRMPTVQVYPLPEDQERRLRQAGFEKAKAMTVEKVWNQWVSQEEKERVDSLEGLDEVEEWQLLADHYVVAWGSRGEGFSGLWDGGDSGSREKQ